MAVSVMIATPRPENPNSTTPRDATEPMLPVLARRIEPLESRDRAMPRDGRRAWSVTAMVVAAALAVLGWVLSLLLLVVVAGLLACAFATRAGGRPPDPTRRGAGAG